MIAEVRLWGRTIGAVSMEDGRDYATFQFTPEFVDGGIQVSPVTMPLTRQNHEFPELPRRTFHGLPGLLADSLPDRFGNALIDAWLATEGRSPGSFSAIERLCYTGTRGMGALEYAPVLGPKPRHSTKINVDALGLKQGRADSLLEEVTAVVERWPEFAAKARLAGDITEKIGKAHRLDLRS